MEDGARGSEGLRDQLERLTSSHLCVSYDDPADRFALAVPFLGIGLERRQKCVYVQDDASDSGVALLSAMRSEGLEVDAALRSGALSIMRTDAAYLAHAEFDPPGMIDWVERQVHAARAEGHSALRLVGEGSRSLASHPDVRRFAEYERMLNPFVNQHPVAFLCQYERRQFAPEIVREVIASHPWVMAGGRLCRNPYHVPPDAYLAPDWRDREIDWLLGNLSRLQRSDDALRESGERYRRLSKHLLDVQEKERQSMARELHDQLGQTLTAICLALRRAGRGGVDVDDSLALVDEATEQMRGLALDLRPPSLDHLGLPAALHSYLERVGKRAGLDVRLDVVGSFEERLPRAVETACFRLVQETLTNVARHAGARRVDVELAAVGGEAIVTIRDDGKGFDVGAVRARGGGLGLLGMEERVALAGGQLKVMSEPGRGSTIRARFPRGPPQHAVAPA